MKKKLFPYAFSITGGFVACYLIAQIFNKREAWDSPAYFTIGLPLMCLLILAISWFFPKSAWHWTVAMMLGQAAANEINNQEASWNLWPLGLIALAVFSLPQFILGFIASWISSRIAAKGNKKPFPIE